LYFIQRLPKTSKALQVSGEARQIAASQELMIAVSVVGQWWAGIGEGISNSGKRNAHTVMGI